MSQPPALRWRPTHKLLLPGDTAVVLAHHAIARIPLRGAARTSQRRTAWTRSWRLNGRPAADLHRHSNTTHHHRISAKRMRFLVGSLQPLPRHCTMRRHLLGIEKWIGTLVIGPGAAIHPKRTMATICGRTKSGPGDGKTTLRLLLGAAIAAAAAAAAAMWLVACRHSRQPDITCTR